MLRLRDKAIEEEWVWAVAGYAVEVSKNAESP